MPEVVAIEWVMALAGGGLVLGLLIGYGLSFLGGTKSKVGKLSQALEAAEEELADYKRDVFGQFAETAEKFRALDKSYNELHRQLAQSSVALCGDAAMPLLAGPVADAALEEKEIAQDGEAEESDAVVMTEASAEDLEQSITAADEAADAEAGETKQAEAETAAEDIVVSEKAEAVTVAEEEAASASAEESVPILTDSDVPRRESA